MLQIRDAKRFLARRRAKAVAPAGGWLGLDVFRQFAFQVRAPAKSRFGALRASFFVCILLPTFTALAYLTFFASDEYVSEAKFAVRRASESKLGGILEGLPAALSGIGASGRSTAQDAFIVTDYIRSRTIIQDLGGKELLYDIYARQDEDWWSRLSKPLPLEKVWEYWRNKVIPRIDTKSGIITLEIIAYTPEDARRLGDLVLQRSEALVNQISERSRRDALTRAQNEVLLAQERIRKAQQELLAFRNKNSAIDPVASAESLGSTVTTLIGEKIKLENDRASMIGVISAESPVRRQLDARINDLDAQIAGLKDRLASQKDNQTISSQIAAYEDLQLELQFAEKLYSVSQAAYEQARTEQDKQQLYLATIEKPTIAEQARYPRIVATTSVIFAVCFVLWSMASLVVASIRDHMGG